MSTRSQVTKRVAAGLCLLIGGLGWRVRADGPTNFSLIIQNGGNTKGGAVILDCDGTTVTCTLSGGVVELSGIAGGSGINQLTGDVAAGP